MLGRFQIIGWIALMGTFIASGAEAAPPAAKCQAAKLKEAGKYGLCRLKAEAKAVKSGSMVKLPAALAKCDAKLADKWADAETGGACPTSGDAGRLQSLAIDFSRVATLQLAGARFIDNGDGTITDTQTRLTWEKKNGADGVADLSNPHDVDNQYTWSASGAAPDGTAFTQLLGALNTCFSELGNDGFAGHCDWRLPTTAEMGSLYDFTKGGCELGGVGPCIDPIFTPTAFHSSGRGFAYHWSSISDGTGGTDAKFFSYDPAGGSNFGPKTWLLYVRAVRDDLQPEVLP